MKFKMLRCIAAVGMMLTGLSASAYEQGDTVFVGSDTDTTVFLEAEWYDADSITINGASSIGVILLNDYSDSDTSYLMNNNATLFYTLDVKGDGGTYDVVFSYRSKRFDRYGYIYIDLDGVRHGQINAKNISNFDGRNDWLSSYQNVSEDARNYVSLTLTPGVHNIQFLVAGGSGNFYCDYFALVPRVTKTTEVACTSYEDTVKIEAEFFDPDHALSLITPGYTTMCVRDYTTCVGNDKNADKLVFPLNVGGSGGTFKVEYVYAKLRSAQSARFRPYLDDAAYWGMYNLEDTVTHGQWASYVSNNTQTLSVGSHTLTIQMDYSESHFLDYIRLIPMDLPGVATSMESEIASPLTISPNPVLNDLKFSGNNVAFAKVFDFTGRQLMSQSVMQNSVDVSSLKNGVYLLEMTDESGARSVQRFMKK